MTLAEFIVIGLFGCVLLIGKAYDSYRKRQRTYLALYEVKNDIPPFYHLDFTTKRSSNPPKQTDFCLRTGFTGRIMIFEVEEVDAA